MCLLEQIAAVGLGGRLHAGRSAVQPVAVFFGKPSGNGPNTVCVKSMRVPSSLSARRYMRFDVAPVDMSGGP